MWYFYRNFKNIPCYVMSEVSFIWWWSYFKNIVTSEASLKRFYYAHWRYLMMEFTYFKNAASWLFPNGVYVRHLFYKMF